MNFSARIDFAPARNSLDMERGILCGKGLPAFDVSQSNPTQVGLGIGADRIAAALASRDNALYYPESRGLANARRAIAEHFLPGREASVHADPEHLLLCASTSEAYSYLFKLLCDPGDSILIPRPGYPLFDQLAALESVIPVPYRLEYSHPTGWAIDTDSIARALSGGSGARPKAIVLINPNNPTGSYVQNEELSRIIELCIAYAIPIIADEVFYGYDLEPREGRRSLFGMDDCLTFTLDGFSKRLCLPQAKLGWIYVSGPDTQVRRAMDALELIADSFLSAGAPVMNAAGILLGYEEELRASVKTRMAQALSVYRQVLEGETSPHRILRAEGGWTALVQSPRYADEESLARDLLGQQGLYVHPGFFFDMEKEAFFAFSLILRPEEARKVAEKFRSFFEHYDTH
ncbi:MAG: pyridoxal phosphate-dependent aminotransferase [Spirochaetia bacterium]|jgi:aspartate/methionine/tyrosine aminotransferase|nr:pyridoxal phosphate-dependent aminotransferase [Spirochaetia bacterium]